ncbi:hypothetical protein [Methylobacterium pseudosasicola]|uniref:Uncharacterized protein n=1 Tax=Methylobacterium pseudosasicola TaxID=582667 RepID=A0A1I4PT87_9HYPH|nr:hypothetical protein [Methylobacterium pseudosasicola]SFM30989.1 hypothetical protein SAMN05192568_102650 [Methylobacterium pseudosasicola]
MSRPADPVPQPVAQMPAAAREAVARYLPGEPVEPAFARMLAAYARCERGCLDRIEGNPECRDLCRRAGRALNGKED